MDVYAYEEFEDEDADEITRVSPIGAGKHSVDPRMRGIRRRHRRWEARIWIGDPTAGPPPGTGGSGRGRLVAIGRFLTVEEAIRAREEALRKRAAS